MSMVFIGGAATAGGPQSVPDSTFNAEMAHADVVEVHLEFSPNLYNPDEQATAFFEGRFYDSHNGQWCEIAGGVDTPDEWSNDDPTLTLGSMTNDWQCSNTPEGDEQPEVMFTATWNYVTEPAGTYKTFKQGSLCRGEEFTDEAPTMTFVATVDGEDAAEEEPVEGSYTEQEGTCHPTTGNTFQGSWIGHDPAPPDGDGSTNSFRVGGGNNHVRYQEDLLSACDQFTGSPLRGYFMGFADIENGTLTVETTLYCVVPGLGVVPTEKFPQPFTVAFVDEGNGTISTDGVCYHRPGRAADCEE
jgi:hypothetical protein